MNESKSSKEASVFKSKLLLNKKGFSLVESLLAAGFVGIVGLGISEVVIGTFKQQKGIQAKDHQREITAAIRNLLSEEAACIQTFGGINVMSVNTVTAMKDAAGASKWVVNTNESNNLLKFTKFETSVFVPDAMAPNMGIAEFKVSLEKVNDSGGVKEIRPDVIFLRVEKDAANRLVNCIALGEAVNGLWKKSPSNLSSIYYNGGNVGVGINNPSNVFSVNGNISIVNGSLGINRNPSDGSIPTGGTPGSARFQFTPGTNSFSIQSYDSSGAGTGAINIIGSTGHVGIGTTTPRAALEVNGGILPGSTSVSLGGSCSLQAGTMAYDSTNDLPVYCNSSHKWVSMSGIESQLLATNGYVKYANGLMIQWGRSSALANTTTNVSFPISFPNEVFSVTLSGTSEINNNAKDNWPSLYRANSTMTTSGFRVSSANDTSDDISWIAVGR